MHVAHLVMHAPGGAREAAARPGAKEAQPQFGVLVAVAERLVESPDRPEERRRHREDSGEDLVVGEAMPGCAHVLELLLPPSPRGDVVQRGWRRRAPEPGPRRGPATPPRGSPHGPRGARRAWWGRARCRRRRRRGVSPSARAAPALRATPAPRAGDCAITVSVNGHAPSPIDCWSTATVSSLQPSATTITSTRWHLPLPTGPPPVCAGARGAASPTHDGRASGR